MLFRSASGVQKRLRRGSAGLLFGIGLAFATLADVRESQAQSVWGGTGSTTATTDYSLGTNWSAAPAGAPPIFPTQSAVFGSTGSSTVTIGAGPMLPDSWTFNANSQSFTISGNPVAFSLSGPTGGVINRANTGQTIEISANITDGVGGPIMVQQAGNSTLVLSGTNGYSGGTVISAGTVQVTNADSVGSGTITLSGGTFQMQSPTVVSVAFGNNIALDAAGGTVDANGAQVNLQGVIADGVGAGNLRLIDSTGSPTANVQLSGANTYTGGTLVVGTTVQVTNTSSVGTGTVTLDNARFQTDGLGGDLTFTNNFKINGTAGGGTIDANGVILTIAGNITNGTGAGQMTVFDSSGGNGAVVLLGTNTYTGGTTICDCATLVLGDATHKASIVGDVSNAGRLFIINANTSGITSITNDASIGFGLTTFMGSNTAGTATITNQFGGATVFLETSSAGNARITNTSGGATIFGQSGGNETSTAGNAIIDNTTGTTLFLAGTNAGTATITNQNGAVIFADTASAKSATIVNNFNGFTLFGGGFTDTPTADNAKITNNNGGETDFVAFSTAANAKITTNSGGATLFFDNATGGNAQFITNGTGFVDFSGSHGPNGDGRISAGSIAGSGIYYIGAGNTLVTGGNNLSTEVKGVIADFNPCGCGVPGPGSLEKVGSGNLILSGVNTYTGTTTVNGGKLTVDGSILSSSGTTVNSGGALSVNGSAGSVTVNAGGTLGGNGTVGNTNINGGTLAPGNSIGLLTVQGSLVLSAAATYMVEVSPTDRDRTNVIGTATLGGATVNASFGPGSYVPRQYTILNATNGLGGSTFGSLVNTNLPNNFKTSLTYDANNVYLNTALVFVAPSGGFNINQQNVANAITGFFNSNGGIPLVFGGLTPGGLTQISGELATGSQQATFDAMNIFLGLLTDPFIAGRNGGAGAGGGSAVPFADESGSSAYAAKKPGAARDAFAKFPTKADIARNDLFEQRWSVWGSAFGGGSNSDGNANLGSNNASVRAYGLAAGADYRISPATLVGFALSGGGTNFSVAGSGSGRSDLFQAGAFVRHTVGAVYVTAAAVYGWQDVTTDRAVTVAGVDRLRAEFNANAWSGRAEGGYRFATPWLGITPYAAGQFTTYQLPAYAEQVLSGSNAFALNYAAKDVTAGRSELGVRTDKSFAMQDAILTFRGRAAWAHNFNTDRSVTALFQTLPGATFLVSGAAQAQNTALATASAEMKWLNGWSAAATFEGEFSDITRSYVGKGVVRYAW